MSKKEKESKISEEHLEKIRTQQSEKTKLVNIGINLDHLPNEMKNIENTKKKKEFIYSNYFTFDN